MLHNEKETDFKPARNKARISPDSHFCKYEKLKPATAMNRPTEHIPAQTWLRPRLPGYRVAGTFQIRDNPGCVAEMAE